MQVFLTMLQRTPRTMASLLFPAGLGIWTAGSEPSPPKSDNSWSKNYDASATNSPHSRSGGNRSRSVVRRETVYVDRDGVIHDKEDLKAYDPSEIEIR